MTVEASSFLAETKIGGMKKESSLFGLPPEADVINDGGVSLLPTRIFSNATFFRIFCIWALIRMQKSLDGATPSKSSPSETNVYSGITSNHSGPAKQG